MSFIYQRATKNTTSLNVFVSVDPSNPKELFLYPCRLIQCTKRFATLSCCYKCIRYRGNTSPAIYQPNSTAFCSSNLILGGNTGALGDTELVLSGNGGGIAGLGGSGGGVAADGGDIDDT